MSVRQVSGATHTKLLRQIERLETQLHELHAAGAVEPFEAKLHEYEALIDRMKASPLWPDTVAELRAQVEASDSVPVAHLSERANASNGVQLRRRGNR